MGCVTIFHMQPSDFVPLSDREILVGLRKDVRHLTDTLDRELKFQNKRADDFETRIRTLEKFRWYLMGAVIGSAGISAALAAAVTHAVSQHLLTP